MKHLFDPTHKILLDNGTELRVSAVVHYELAENAEEYDAARKRDEPTAWVASHDFTRATNRQQPELSKNALLVPLDNRIVWVGGDTYYIKGELKARGGRYADRFWRIRYNDLLAVLAETGRTLKPSKGAFHHIRHSHYWIE